MVLEVVCFHLLDSLLVLVMELGLPFSFSSSNVSANALPFAVTFSFLVKVVAVSHYRMLKQQVAVAVLHYHTLK